MQSFLASILKQTIVLWKSPVNNGYGTITFATPIEIKGRWQWRRDLLDDNNVQQQVSRATVYTMAEVDEENWVYLGNLADLSTAEKANPKLLEKAYVVKQINQYVQLKNVDCIYRRLYLE